MDTLQFNIEMDTATPNRTNNMPNHNTAIPNHTNIMPNHNTATPNRTNNIPNYNTATPNRTNITPPIIHNHTREEWETHLCESEGCRAELSSPNGELRICLYHRYKNNGKNLWDELGIEHEPK